jgi:hypothetical protein
MTESSSAEAIIPPPPASMSSTDATSNAPRDGDARLPFRDRLRAALPHLLLLLPLLAAIVFVQRSSVPFPTTDEWFFLEAGMQFDGVPLFSGDAFAFDRDDYPRNYCGHPVAAPFLLYRPIEEWTSYDSRYLMYLTVAGFALQAWFFRRRMVTSSLWALPIFMLMLSPSHYMEFMWGWQFTLAFSLLFPIAGLFVLDGMPMTSLAGRAWRVAACALLCLLGALSSAPGLFGAPCAALLVALKPLRRLEKACWMAVFLLSAFGTWKWLLHDPDPPASISFRMFPQTLTALGGTIWSTPFGMFEFGLNLLTITGAVIVACFVAVLLRAAAEDVLSRLAFGASVAVFGLLCVLSVTLVRTYLGNWHLQLALPAVCGAYACAWVLWRTDRSRYAAVPFFTLLACLAAGVVGWFAGLTNYGPEYSRYVHNVQTYALNYLEQPDLPHPHPPGPVLTPRHVLFLSAKENPMFADVPPPGKLHPLPAAARVFVEQEEVARPLSLSGGSKPRVLTVAIPRSTRARGIVARFGDEMLVLRRIHADLAGLECCAEPETACFAGMVLSSRLGAGPKDVRFAWFE